MISWFRAFSFSSFSLLTSSFRGYNLVTATSLVIDGPQQLFNFFKVFTLCKPLLICCNMSISSLSDCLKTWLNSICSSKHSFQQSASKAKNLLGFCGFTGGSWKKSPVTTSWSPPHAFLIPRDCLNSLAT
eukprot:Gb_05937 [translate_table: standard]